MSEITTSCRDCVFAVYEADTQDGCYFGRIEKFEARGATVTGVDDGEKKYLVVDRVCSTKRVPTPGVTSPPVFLLGPEVRKQVMIKFGAVVYLGPGSTKDELSTSLSSLASQSVKPVKVVVLLDVGCDVTRAAAAGLIKRSGLGCVWEAVSVEPWDREASESYLGNAFDHAVDIGVGSFDVRHSMYYTVARAGWEWPQDYTDRIDRAINDELIPLTVVFPAEGDNGYAVQTIFHKHSLVCGNVGGNVLTKVEIVKEHFPNGWRAMAFGDLP